MPDGNTQTHTNNIICIFYVSTLLQLICYYASLYNYALLCLLLLLCSLLWLLCSHGTFLISALLTDLDTVYALYSSKTATVSHLFVYLHKILEGLFYSVYLLSSISLSDNLQKKYLLSELYGLGI